MRRVLVCLAICVTALVSAAPSFKVKVTGHGKPMILIPGLSCGGDVWDAVVNHYKDKYECHVLSLPGFVGTPGYTGGPFLPKIRDEVIQYVKDQKLDHPVLMGHSLGSTLSLWIASTAPDLFGPVVAVDGLPWTGGLFADNNMPKARQMADAYTKALGKLSQADYAKQTAMFLDRMITDPKVAAKYNKESALSNPKAVGQAMSELLTTDLRPDVEKIQSPVLVLAAAQFAVNLESQNQLLGTYESQVARIPHHSVVLALKARHFIFLDSPEFFFQSVDKFLSLP